MTFDRNALKLFDTYLVKFIEVVPYILFVLILVLRFNQIVPRSRQDLPSRYHGLPKDTTQFKLNKHNYIFIKQFC